MYEPDPTAGPGATPPEGARPARADAGVRPADAWRMLRRAVDALPEAGMLCNAPGRVLHANAVAHRWLAGTRSARALRDAVARACAVLQEEAPAAAARGDAPTTLPARVGVMLGGVEMELRAIDLGRGTDGATSIVLVLVRAEWPTTADQADALSSRRLQRLHITRTEGVIARMLAARLTDGEIAAALGSSVRTVQTHVQHILGKLGVHTRRAVGPALTSAADTPPAPTRHSPPDA